MTQVIPNFGFLGRGGKASSTPGRNIFPPAAMAYIRKRTFEVCGLFAVALSAGLAIALFSYSSSDPSLNSASSTAAQNLMGLPGALLADLLFQFFGLAGFVLVFVIGAWGWQLLHKRPLRRPVWRTAALTLALGLVAISLAEIKTPESWSLIAGTGGVVGGLSFSALFAALGTLNIPQTALIVRVIALIIGLPTLVWSLGLSWQEWREIIRGLKRGFDATIHALSFGVGRLRSFAEYLLDLQRDSQVAMPGAPVTVSEIGVRVSVGKPDTDESDDPTQPLRTGLVASTTGRVKPGRKAKAAQQASFDLDPNGEYQLPPLHLLEEIIVKPGKDIIKKDALEQNAKYLATVLADFGIKGEIVKVRPGPVVTLYELEPAPGTKTSRVIGLSDDIARSMSAVSVRIAVVPGRSVIGIELPNMSREMVHLRELVASETFEKTAGKLPLALGKDIGGAPITADLSKMPHLLIAGTTGSGKSVAMNTMILSLLYSRTPDECKFIMIDPKMLELSVYEGIPHLLTPVVTDPGKAVVALKWTVREMEDRYRSMSQLGVRNIAGYNSRLVEAAKKGEVLTRSVQTGFDHDGKPVMEDQPLGSEPLPYIVVVVDEMADLMLVAGKDVEAAIQRLAQMARAAGIHIIMATQRPSVDVITGTIKANFPTRISFQVTSKIDSRTILGEQGAEQLLGQGDMLYMAGGGRISRIHGPFVSDEEVEKIVTHLKCQAAPTYIEEVTSDEQSEFSSPVAGGGNAADALYDEAVALIAREGKASTSFIQRHLQIGYNRAARIIEQMEKEGVVSPANRVGRREVLIGDH